MKTPKKKDVIKYFENAELIADAYTGDEFNLSDYDLNDAHYGDAYCTAKDFYVYKIVDKNDKKSLWDDKKGYAKILSYKEPKEKTYKIKQETGMDSITINDVKYIKEDKDSYKITKEQILELHKNASCNSKYDIKQLFPEVFETKLEVGKWYKYNNCLLRFQGVENGIDMAYGFLQSGEWIDKDKLGESSHEWKEATDQEVEEALKGECVKLGLKKGVHFKTPCGMWNGICTDKFMYNEDYDILYCGGKAVYNKGKFASVIPTISKQEAEQKLKEIGVNAKIV